MLNLYVYIKMLERSMFYDVVFEACESMKYIGVVRKSYSYVPARVLKQKYQHNYKPKKSMFHAAVMQRYCNLEWEFIAKSRKGL